MVRQDRMQSPTDATLSDSLGGSYGAFRALIEAYPELEPQWKWYGQKSGWSLKMLDGKRNVCFLNPGEGRFTVGFTFGHDAVERALESDLPVPVRQLIAGARTYAEGRPFRLEVEAEDQLEPVHQLIRIKRAGKGGTATRHARNRAERRSAPAPDRMKAPVASRPEHTAPSHRRGRSPG